MTDVKKKTAILILGAHRSGTSALTRMISLLGYDLPQNLMTSLDGNEAGHWESEALAQMNDSLLEELNLAWYEWYPYRLDQIGSKRKQAIIEDLKLVLLNEYPDLGDCVIKDPRICRLTEFVIPAIKQMPADLKIIIPFRNPLEVMASLEKRNGISKPQAALIWLRYVLDAEIGSRGEDRVFIPYEGYLNAPENSMSTICKALKLKPINSVEKVSKQLQAFVRNDLKHHNYGHDLLLMEPATRGWVSDTVKNLMILKDDPNNVEALTSLDDIRLQFGKVTPILKASLNSLYLAQEAKIKESESNLAQKETEAETLKNDIEKLHNAIPQLEETVSQRASEIEARDKKIDALQEEIKAQKIQKEQIEGELSQLSGTLAHRNTEIIEEKKRSAEEIKQLRSERSILSETIERVEAEKKKHQTDYDRLVGEYESLLKQSEAFQNSNQDLQSHIETIEAEKKKHQADYEKLETEHEKLEDKIDRFSQEHDLLLEEYERLAQERSTLRETIGRIDSEKKKHQEDYARLSNEHDETLKHRDSLQQQNQNLEDRTHQLDMERQGLLVKIRKADEDKQSLSQQLTENREAQKSFERQHTHLIQTKEAEITELLSTKLSLEDEVSHVRERLKQEQRTVLKPLLRRIRSTGGAALRFFLPHKWVNKMALMAPTAEQKILLEHAKAEKLRHNQHTDSKD